MTPSGALAELAALADPAKAAAAAAYHKIARPYLGISVPDITALTGQWRAVTGTAERVAIADALWQSNIHEARIAAARLLTQARIAGDEAVWRLIASWVPDFDGWSLADHACDAGRRRLIADPARIDAVEGWTRAPHLWTRRAALVITLPWTRQNFPSASDLAVRDRVLGWAAGYAGDPEWFIQKAIAWWLRDLSKHDAPRVTAWLQAHGARLKPFARREASKYLGSAPRERRGNVGRRVGDGTMTEP